MNSINGFMNVVEARRIELCATAQELDKRGKSSVNFR
jgi:hypothetical protein